MIRTERNKCTGCHACAVCCPKNAIKMTYDDEGFAYPVVNKKLCIKCNLCNKICPALNLGKGVTAKEAPVVYAAYVNDDAVRKESSSGGLFTAIARLVLARGGYVCGAAFDEKSKLSHILISDEKDLYKLRGSKYVQSRVGDIFKDIKKLLDKDKFVLFSGTPCQVAGLNHYLVKPYKNLLTIDVVCHGVPSQKTLDAYLQDIVPTGSNIEDIRFRDKTNGWKKLTSVVRFKDKTGAHEYKCLATDDAYMKGFLKNLYLRPCCSTCDYTKMPRESDFTLGDFWGIKKYDKKLDDDKGLSLVLVNTEKAERFFEGVKPLLSVCVQVPLKTALAGNVTLTRPWESHPNRTLFFKQFIGDDKMRFKNTVNDALAAPQDVGILNLFFSRNYGAVLTAYALVKAVRDAGYSGKLIQYVPKRHQKFFGTKFDRFAKEHIPMTSLCTNYPDLIALNNSVSKFIVGSDQVWRYEYTGFAEDAFYLGFASLDKTILSYAASFGKDTYDEAPSSEVSIARYCLKRFDAISVREDSGVSICKNTFGVKASFVLDPVFLIDQSDWEKLSALSTAVRPSHYIAYNVLDEDHRFVEAFSHISKDIELPLLNIMKSDEVHDWLAAIKHADLFVTDSFHGVCFALLFRKQFACVANIRRGYERFKSLLSLVGLEDRILTEPDAVKIKNILDKPINYDAVFKKINALGKTSLAFLTDALSAQKKAVDPVINGLEEKQRMIQLDPVYYASYGKNKRRYFFYSIMSKLTFGEKRKSYKEKKKVIKHQIKYARRYIRLFLED